MLIRRRQMKVKRQSTVPYHLALLHVAAVARYWLIIELGFRVRNCLKIGRTASATFAKGEISSSFALRELRAVASRLVVSHGIIRWKN